MRAIVCAASSLLLLDACTNAPYAEVHHINPHLAAPAGTGQLSLVERLLAQAIHERSKPLVAMGDCLMALKIASDELKRNPNNAIAMRDYNFGISRIFQIIEDTKFDAWSKPVTVPS